MTVLVVIVGVPLFGPPRENGRYICKADPLFVSQYLKNISKNLDLGDWGIKFVVVVLKRPLFKYKNM